MIDIGTRLVDDPYGGKATIANVFRRNNDSELAKMIAAHLIDQEIPRPHPGDRTIRRMLANMPASRTRSLEVSSKQWYTRSRNFRPKPKVFSFRLSAAESKC